MKHWKWGDGAPWRVSVRSEAAALEEMLERTRDWYRGLDPKPQSEPLDPRSFRGITDAIERDVETALKATAPPKGVLETIAVWWTGSRVEMSWAALHRATQSLLLVASPGDVRAQFPDMEWQVRASFADADTRKNEYLTALKEEAAKRDDSIDRQRLFAIRRIRDQVWDAAHADLRQFRNILLVLTLAVAAFVGVLVALDLNPGLVPVCAGSSKQSTICPSGENVAGWKDALTVAVLGSVGGLLAAAVSLQRVDRSGSPYNVVVAQAILKVPAGAVTAVFGSVLIANQVLGIKVTPGTGQLAAYAALFGYAQQTFTRSVENRANTLLAATPGSHPPQSP